MYASSPEEQQEWVVAFKKVLMGLHKDDPESAYASYHCHYRLYIHAGD